MLWVALGTQLRKSIYDPKCTKDGNSIQQPKIVQSQTGQCSDMSGASPKHCYQRTHAHPVGS